MNKCCVVTTSHTSVVVTNCIKPVAVRRLSTLLGNVSRQVKIMSGEINKSLQLVLEETAVRESFQVNHQYFWQSPEIQFLPGLTMLLANRTIPKIDNSRLENLWLPRFPPQRHQHRKYALIRRNGQLIA